MNDNSVAWTIMIVVSVVVGVLAAGWHIWYAMGLSRVFAQHDTDPWRAWVPFMNEAEVLRLGRVDPVKVALFLVPVVNLYALVLKGVAARRLDSAAGRGVGSTVLAVLLPPVWAMIAGQSRGASPTAVAVAEDAPAPGVAFPAPPAPPSAAPVPPARPATGGVIGTQAPVAALPAPALPSVALLPTPPAPAPGTAAPSVAASAAAPAAPIAPRPESLHEEPAPLTRRARRDDATAIVRPPAAWEMLLPSGEVVAVTARIIVLGRSPNPAEPGVQYVAVSDEGRTVSKHHARLEWDGQSWIITDLGSTNGVAVVDAAGEEQTLPAEGTASVVERFVLGDAVVSLRRAGA